MEDFEFGQFERELHAYDQTITDLAKLWGPGSDAWEGVVPKYDQGLQVDIAFDMELRGRIGPMGKRVVINDYLPAGQIFVTDGEIILSKQGWEWLIAALDRQNQCRVDVGRIIERRMGDVLAWLREAGHAV